MRTLLERWTRNWTFRRRLPAANGGGMLVVSPSAGLSFLFRPMTRVDPVLLRLAREFVRPGAVVWDVGANVGLFTFSAAHIAGAAGCVLAIEPDAWLVQLLRESAQLQGEGAAAVEILPMAVAAAPGIRTYCTARRSRSSNHLKGYGSSQTGGVGGEVSVLAVSLDWLMERRPVPDLLKIDVEGAELEALEGALALLGTKRPVVICEVAAAVAGPLTRLLHSFGYTVFDGEREPQFREPLSEAPWCTVAIPGAAR